MKIVKSSKGTQETMLNIILILGGIFLVGALLQYGNNKSMTKDLMTSSNNVNNTRNMNENQSNTPSPNVQTVPQSQNSISASSDDVFENQYESVNNIKTSGVPNNNNKQVIMNPNELLPNQQTSNSALMNPPRNDLKNMNFLSPDKHIGINTVGNTLRNPNLQIRSEPSNPQAKPGPWNLSTINPDPYRRELEIGSN